MASPAPDEPDFQGLQKYHMSGRGHLLVFSNTEFEIHVPVPNPGHGDQPMKRVPNLVSSRVDGDRLLAAVQREKFVSCQHLPDLMGIEMYAAIKALSKEESLTTADFLVMVFLTYGDSGLVFARDGKIALQRLLHLIKADNCLGLAGKPKLIILQTTEVPRAELESDGFPEKVVTIPSDADFLYLWSRLPADKFVKQPDEGGSLFISTLIEELKNEREPDQDVLKTMTRTIAAVERKLGLTEEGREWMEKQSELPFFINQLTGTLCLKQYF